MLNFNSLLLFSDNPKRLVEFYKKVFQKDPDWMGGDFIAFMVGSGTITIGPHSKVHGKNTSPERIMFNLETKDVENEFNRIKGLGAVVIAETHHPSEDKKMSIATLADPDGNYFQLITPMKME